MYMDFNEKNWNSLNISVVKGPIDSMSLRKSCKLGKHSFSSLYNFTIGRIRRRSDPFPFIFMQFSGKLRLGPFLGNPGFAIAVL